MDPKLGLPQKLHLRGEIHHKWQETLFLKMFSLLDSKQLTINVAL